MKKKTSSDQKDKDWELIRWFIAGAFFATFTLIMIKQCQPTVRTDYIEVPTKVKTMDEYYSNVMREAGE